MISILDNSLKRVAIIKDIIEPWRFEEINGENTLEFKAVLTEKIAGFLDENNVIEFDDDYFDIAYYSKDLNEDGTATINIECEHISYRLNNPEYNLDYFTFIGTPTQILNEILNDTGFTVGTIEFSDEMTYSAQERMSRRAILMEFVALLGGEVKFNKFCVSILKRRGNNDIQIFTKGKNIKIISKVYDGRENPPRIAYICTPIVLPNKNIDLGDDILLVQPELNIQDNLRVVSIGYNPLEPMEQEIEIANYINGLEDQLYRIETTTVTKEKVYNGCKIGPNEGFVAERSDGKAKTVMNATEGISIFSDVGQGLQRNFFVDLDGRIQARELDISGDATFQGTVHASTIETSEFIGGRIEASEFVGGSIKIGETSSGYYDYNFSVDSEGNLFARNGYFEGDINASWITGSTITSSNIDVDTSVTIGNYLYIGSYTGSYSSKGIDISHGGNSTWLEVDSSGDFKIYSWGRLTLDAFDDILIWPTEVKFDVYDFLVDSRDIMLYAYEIVLDGYSYLWDNRTEDNRIATWEDLDDLWYDIIDLL